METGDVLRAMLMYFLLPLWLAGGFSDYLCPSSRAYRAYERLEGIGAPSPAVR
jgi:hypothetical protein